MARRVGLDIGARTVRAIAMVPAKAGWTVAGHAAVPRRDAAGGERPLAVVLAEIDAVLRLKSARVSVANRQLSTLIRFVASAPMPRERLEKLLRLELAQHVEGSDELAADTFAVPLAGDELIHCCVLAQPAQVYDLVADLAKVGVSPARVHHVGAALVNATLPAPPVEGDDLALLVDLDADATQVALVGERRLLACRQIAIGADAFAEALARSRGEAMRSETGKIRKAQADADARAAAAPAPIAVPPGAPAAKPTLGSDTVTPDEPLRFEDEGPSPAKPAVGAPLAPLTPPAPGPAAAPGLDSDVLFVPELGDEPPQTRSEQEHFVLDIETHDDDAPEAGAASRLDTRDLHRANASTVDQAPDLDGLRFDDDSKASSAAPTEFGPELQRVAEQLYGQLASSLAWFRAQLRTPLKLEPARVLLSGDAARIPGLAEWLAKRFAKPVALLDTTSALTGRVPDDGAAWAGAIGLALSDAPDAIALDLAPDALVAKREWRERLVWPFAAAAAVVVAGILGAATLLHRAGVEQQSLDAYQAYVKQWNDDQAELDRLHAEKDAMADDLRAIASRMYSGRDLLYAVRALKEQAPEHKEAWVTRFETVGVGKEEQQGLPVAAASRAGKGRQPKVEVVDTTKIDRGAVNITGRVRFDATKSEPELNEYFNAYTTAIERWSFAAEEEGKQVNVGLFDPSKTWLIDHFIAQDEEAPPPAAKAATKRARPTLKKGEFWFIVQFAFRPTQLSQLTTRLGPAAADGGG